MTGWKRVAVIALVSVLALVLVLFVVGLALPVEHESIRSGEYPVDQELVWTRISDVEDYPSWREVERIEVLARDRTGEVVRFIEHSSDGAMTFAILDRDPPNRMVVDVVESGGPFGGQWVYELESSGARTRLTITEYGWIDNALLRTLARFVFGYSTTQDQVLRQLGEALGAEVEPE